MGTHIIWLSKEIDKTYTDFDLKIYGNAWLCTYRGICSDQAEYSRSGS